MSTMTRELRKKFEAVLGQQGIADKEVLASALAEAAKTVSGLEGFDTRYFTRNKKTFLDIAWDEVRDSKVKASGKFVSGLVDAILYEVEATLQKFMKELAVIGDFPQDLLPIMDRLMKGLGFGVLPMTEEAIEVYRWVKEQDEKGNKIETFTAWATHDSRKDFANKYRYKVINIKADYPQAFLTSGRGIEILVR